MYCEFAGAALDESARAWNVAWSFMSRVCSCVGVRGNVRVRIINTVSLLSVFQKASVFGPWLLHQSV